MTASRFDTEAVALGLSMVTVNVASLSQVSTLVGDTETEAVTWASRVEGDVSWTAVVVRQVLGSSVPGLVWALPSTLPHPQ